MRTPVPGKVVQQKVDTVDSLKQEVTDVVHLNDED